MVKGGKNAPNAVKDGTVASPSAVPPAPSPAPPAALPPPQLPPFLSKCYDMVDDPSTDPTVSWSAAGNSFVLWDPHAFVRDLLPKYFKHSNLSSFVRQLNTYGFHKVDPDRWEFANEGFLKGQKHLLKTIVRRKPAQNIVQSSLPQGKNNSVVQTCVEVGKFGLEEEIERLKRDKAVLMQELVKLRQHQQNTDNELRHVRDRIQVMEQQQQQMLSFLAMAVQSPGFLSQFVQQNGNNWWRVQANKKRRLPAPEKDTHCLEPSPKGQIVKYQDVTTESLEPFFSPAENSNLSPELSQLSNGINDMSIDMDNISIDVDSFLSMGDGSHPNISDDVDWDWLQTLASETPENDLDNDLENLGFSSVGMDFELPEHEIYVEHNKI